MFCIRQMCRQTSPVVYEIGGYLVSPVNSILSYLARIHCSLKTLQMSSKTYTARQKLQTTKARFIKQQKSIYISLLQSLVALLSIFVAMPSQQSVIVGHKYSIMKT